MKDLLKFITCGSVDDGKSTLIGHILYDAKLIFADQRQRLEIESKLGNENDDLNYSLLLDGLAAEREQGITIDVAYRYFSTEKRSFIVADAPGHEEYTKNMAVGASFANLAVILIDGQKGISKQTLRHIGICILMGIKDYVFAVNKMDLLQYDKQQFCNIKNEIEKVMKNYDISSLMTIPVSAQKGDNLTSRSANMPWYTGTALLNYLESIDVYSRLEESSFLLPIQRVCRPNSFFRGFQGQIETGTLSLNDEVTVLPSKERAKITEILIGDKAAQTAQAGQAVTICLDKEIDVSRGCVIERKSSACVGTCFSAKILWLEDEPLRQGRNFVLKLGTQAVPAIVTKILYTEDIYTRENIPCDYVNKNEIAHCEITLNNQLVFNSFDNNIALGSLILINRISLATSACGTIDKAIFNNNLTWQSMEITREMRERQNSQKAYTIWFTGLSGSGKSTLACELEKRLFVRGKHTMLLDGDNLRMGINRELGFSQEDRKENIRRVSEIAKLVNEAGVITITSLISPLDKDRKMAKKIIGESFILVYISTSLSVCEKRDVKGLYKKARTNEIENFTGISAPYEVPYDADIVLNTDSLTVSQAAEELMGKLNKIMQNSPD